VGEPVGDHILLKEEQIGIFWLEAITRYPVKAFRRIQRENADIGSDIKKVIPFFDISVDIVPHLRFFLAEQIPTEMGDPVVTGQRKTDTVDGYFPAGDKQPGQPPGEG